ncbi:MAG: DMT family transporter [Clostridia bacterium]|nr:DMT family transporter [Clostridia bacterium]
MTKRELMADAILVLTAFIWGTGFVVMKNTLDSVPPGAIIAIRYAIASVLTAVMFKKHLKGLARADVKRGAVVGLLLSGAYIVQTIGLSMTTAGKNAFLTTVYVLLVPFGCYLVFHQKLNKTNFIAAAMMLAGIGCLSLDGESGGLNLGDLLTLCAGVLFAAHIMAVDRSQERTNTYALIVLQFAFAAAFALVYSLLFERGMPLVITLGTAGGLLYLSVFSTTVAMSLQNIGQSMAPASHAAILLSLESVFGALASWLLLGERLTPTMLLGFAIIFCALVVNSLKAK